MRVWILVEGIFDHSSLQNISSSVRFDGFRAWTARFRSHHRFSIIFRSGDWDGHSRTLYLFLCMNALVDFERCLGSLSCWSIQPRRNFNFVTDSWTLFARICWYWLESMRPSTLTRLPVPALATQPHSMMEPPPNFTVGSKCLSWNAVFFFRHAYRPLLCPNNSILVSSVHSTFFQNEAGLSKCALAYLKRLCLWHVRRKGFCRITLPYSISLCKVRWIVERCTVTPSAARSCCRSLELVCGLSLTVLTILRLCLSEIFLGLPLRALTTTVPVVFHFLTMFLTVETDSLNLWASFLYPSPKPWCWTIFVFRSFDSCFEAPMLPLFREDAKRRTTCNWPP